jgi:hypothetical protein
MNNKRQILLLILFSILFSLTSINSYSQNINVPIVFVSRNLAHNGNIFYPQAGLLPGMGPFSRTSVVGGKLMMRDASGSVTTLIDSTIQFGNTNIIDVQQPCVHWNGEKIVFAGIEHRDSSWRIYELKNNFTRLSKITHTDRNINLAQFGNAASKFTKYDDIDPVYLPDGKIVFASTRYPTLSIYKGFQTTNLFIIDSLGNNLFRVTTERNGGEKPSIDPISGRILYSRWWVNIDRPSDMSGTGFTRVDSLALTNDIANIWQVNIVNPDGDMLKQYGTDARNRKALFSYRPRIMPDGKMVSVYIPLNSMTTTSGSPGIRVYDKGFAEARKIYGVDSSTALLVQNPPSYGTMQPPYATDPVPLPDGRILFSYSTSATDSDFGIYAGSILGGNLTQVIDLPGTLELNAEILAPRPAPPVVDYLEAFDTNMVPPTTNPATFYQGGLFRFDCLNIYSNAPVDAPIDDAPPIQKNAKFRFFLNFQRQNELGEDHPILFREIPVDRDGKIAQGDIPANVSMFEQVVDSNNHLLRHSDGEFSHVLGMNFGNNGSGTKCVGCHAGHTMITVPVNLFEGSFTNLSTSAKVRESSFLSAGGNTYKGKNVVDRKARNNDMNVNWISAGSINEYVVLKWDIPVDVRRFVLYDITPNSGTGTDIHVTDCEIILYEDGQTVGGIPSTGPLSTQGTTVQVGSIVTIDSAKIIVKSFTGNINNNHVAGFAEIETNARVSSNDLTSVSNSSEIADNYLLDQNYPNPFNPSTKIRFSLPKSQNVSLKVYDINGKEVALLISGKVQGGNNSIDFFAGNLPSGIYIYRLEAGNFVESKKMILIK